MNAFYHLFPFETLMLCGSTKPVITCDICVFMAFYWPISSFRTPRYIIEMYVRGWFRYSLQNTHTGAWDPSRDSSGRKGKLLFFIVYYRRDLYEPRLSIQDVRLL